MRSVAEYLERAAEFEALAAKATVDVLRRLAALVFPWSGAIPAAHAQQVLCHSRMTASSLCAGFLFFPPERFRSGQFNSVLWSS